MKLSQMISFWRWQNKKSLPVTAREIGISHQHLARIENGYRVGRKAMVKILDWVKK